MLQLAEVIALTHHEWWDGSGYPQGLKGDQIPTAGRIVALADAHYAMSNDRPYEEAWTVEESVAEIKRLSGSQFDPEVVRVFAPLCVGLVSHSRAAG